VTALIGKRWVAYITQMWEIRNNHKIVVGKFEGTAVSRSVNMRLCVHVAHDMKQRPAFMKAVKKLIVTYKASSFSSRRNVSFSRRTVLHGSSSSSS
jgi:hypothetical protein